jgi:hypothetical protein
MDENRLKHSYAVAKKMIEIGKEKNLSDEELEDLYLLGFNHDMAYHFTEYGKDHNIIGGEILKRNGYKYWKEVYYHGKITDEYDSLYLTILNQADMQINKYGEDVGYTGRLKDIEERFGTSSDVYLWCKNLIDNIKEK